MVRKWSKVQQLERMRAELAVILDEVIEVLNEMSDIISCPGLLQPRDSSVQYYNSERENSRIEEL